jgi:hypothetical protein
MGLAGTGRLLMHYYIQRYRHGLWKLRRWLPLVFLPPVIYLLVAAVAPDRFSVSQTIVVKKTAPIALSRTPVDIMTMEELAANPAGLFLDDVAVMDVTKSVGQSVHGLKEDAASLNLRDVIANSMSLKTADGEHVLLSYYGRDVEMGKLLVNYYIQRLVNRSKEGLVRSARNLNRTSGGSESKGPPGFQPTPNDDAAGAEPTLHHLQPAAPEGNLIIEEHRVFWRSDRLLPAAGILAGSLVFMLILAVFVEWTDPSFKTERQISRYLDLRVIGVMPNLEPLVRRMKS